MRETGSGFPRGSWGRQAHLQVKPPPSGGHSVAAAHQPLGWGRGAGQGGGPLLAPHAAAHQPLGQGRGAGQGGGPLLVPHAAAHQPLGQGRGAGQGGGPLLVPHAAAHRPLGWGRGAGQGGGPLLVPHVPELVRRGYRRVAQMELDLAYFGFVSFCFCGFHFKRGDFDCRGPTDAVRIRSWECPSEALRRSGGACQLADNCG